MNKLIVTMKDIQRHKVLTEVLGKKLSLTDAAELLSISYRHAIRLKQIMHFKDKNGALNLIQGMIDDATHEGLHYSVNHEHDDTQIERALEELGGHPYTSQLSTGKGSDRGNIQIISGSSD